MVDLDPQKSLVEWWKRRGKTGNPTIFENADTAAEAREALEQTGGLGVPRRASGFLTAMTGDDRNRGLVIVPIKPSMIDILATQDAVAMARAAGARFTVVFNDVGARERVVEKARELLLSFRSSDCGHSDYAPRLPHHGNDGGQECGGGQRWAGYHSRRRDRCAVA